MFSLLLVKYESGVPFDSIVRGFFIAGYASIIIHLLSIQFSSIESAYLLASILLFVKKIHSLSDQTELQIFSLLKVSNLYFVQ